MGRLQAVTDRTALLTDAAVSAEAIFRAVAALEAQADIVSMAGSPVNPLYINEADSLLFLTTTRTALLVGSTHGHGIIISRLPSEHPSLIRWSAPCFVTLRLRSYGLSVGRLTTHSFVPCMTPVLRQLLSQRGARDVAGLEASLNFGGLQHKADLIAAATDDVGTVGINRTSGTLLDLSFVRGSLQVDTASNSLVYGPGVTPGQVLHGGVEAPREMAPLFGLLNSILGTVERVTPAARVSASLERYTSGYDPDRRMVLPDGTVARDDLKEPPKDR